VKIDITPKDEYLHTPPPDLLWREGYHFNGYDTAEKMGITISIGIRPTMGIKEELVVLHAEHPLLFVNVRELDQNVLAQENFRMEPVQPLKMWKIRMEDSFQKIENGKPVNISEEVKLDLQFGSVIEQYGYSTERGDRYEQPGILKGKIRIEDTPIEFEGRGIRDHSWETRDMAAWQEWYAFMGWISPGSAASIVYIRHDDAIFGTGWLKADTYYDVRDVQVHPYLSGDILETCTMNIETLKESVTMRSQLHSHVSLSLGREGAELVETVAHLDEGGYGFLWYGYKR
jgi:hypothetical protein